ncbi:hypothetical protein BDN72DRAFT_463507 [Pluteus cervinus]|uniref:Uncharacterized protein n=1 Tax=Pluteus cervinus TaxID=181527 RepID=A0ACD3B162_9AGAR|nr:hypothetical protein BDN72DRAFT_463507 [Pluteus cervinus]
MWKLHLHPDIAAHAADILHHGITESKSVEWTDATINQTFSKADFDYLIIGGGTAGLTIASRLAANDKYSVGVIEAGVDHLNDALITTPQLYGRTVGNPNYDWGFLSVNRLHTGLLLFTVS